MLLLGCVFCWLFDSAAVVVFARNLPHGDTMRPVGMFLILFKEPISPDFSVLLPKKSNQINKIKIDYVNQKTDSVSARLRNSPRARFLFSSALFI